MTAPGHELAIERSFDATVATVWRAITDHIAEWWCPKPWTTEVVALEWTPGGRFALTMRGTDGEVAPIEGVLLSVEPERRIVFCNALNADWQPQDAQPMAIVGVFELSDLGGGRTGWRASARHWSAEDAAKHEAMGFADGWGICANQLEAVAKSLNETADA